VPEHAGFSIPHKWTKEIFSEEVTAEMDRSPDGFETELDVPNMQIGCLTRFVYYPDGRIINDGIVRSVVI
jgi:hypothetical protein